MIGNIDKILVVEVAGIGDLVMSIPALRALRKKYPRSYIAVLVSPRTVDLLKGCPYINDVFTLERDTFKFFRKAFSITAAWHATASVFRLRAKKFDAVVNLYRVSSFWGNLRMQILFFLIKGKLNVGNAYRNWGRFYDLKIIAGPGDKLHEVERKIKVVNLLGADTSDTKLELWIDKEDERAVRVLLNNEGVKENDFLIGLNPNSFQRANLWFEERFASVGDAIIEKYNAKVIIFGAAGDLPRINKITAGMKNKPLNLAGKITLGQYVALIKRLKAFITLDSGPMHIADVFKIPTLVLLGGEDPLRFGPYRNDRAMVLQKKVGCNPCNNKLRCRKMVCMEAITSEEVLKAFEELTDKYL